jgi:hypothetical protein
MHALVALLFFLAQPFWETKPADTWTAKEIDTIRNSSPWAQKVGPEPSILVYFATALPIEDAETELRLRGKNPPREPDAEFQAYVSRHRDGEFVLAIAYRKSDKPLDATDLKRIEEETVMRVGRKQIHISGHFPPIPSDPVLRLVFPREVRPEDRKVVFRLYVPGIDFPDREVDFAVKDMIYHGRLEM